MTGSVAAIRAGRLAPELLAIGEVQAVVTPKAKHFLEPLPAEIPVHDDEAEWSAWTKLGDPVLHIELRRWADVFLLAPLSADSLAKMANGLCDSLVLSVARAWDFSRPILIAPAMNTLMWEHPATAEHLSRLTSWGVRVVSPVSKELACADVGMGAQAPAESIVDAVRKALSSRATE